MKKLLLLNAALVAAIGAFAQSNDNQPKEYPGYRLVFHDEFDVDGQRRMDWDKDFIKLYVDDELHNSTNLNSTVNPYVQDRCWIENYNPFRDHKMYLLLNLALGGDNGGSLDSTQFPCQYLVDYVRIYQKDDDSTPNGSN